MSGIFGGGGGGGSTTTVEKADPWAGVQPYLNAAGGIYPEAQKNYQNMVGTGYIGQSQDQKNLIDQASKWFASPDVSGTYTAGIGEGQKALDGGFDPVLGNVRDVQAPSNNPWLDQMYQGIINKSQQAFGDATADAGNMWNDQIAPSIRGAAQSAGQFGGTRQGIAEGVASSRMGDGLNRYARDLATNAQDAGASLYGNAYAQQMQNELTASQANAGLDVTKNAQAMQSAGQSLQNRLSGLGLTGQAISGQGTNYDQLYNLLGIPQAEAQAAQAYPSDALARYASIVSPGAGIGGTSTSTQPLYQNKTANAMGGALSGGMLGAGLGSMIPGMGAGGVGAGILPGLGAMGGLLLSDRRYKTEIFPIGELDNGLTVYRFRYKSGGPATIGVMADEVKELIPDAVETHGGIDFVNYGRL